MPDIVSNLSVSFVMIAVAVVIAGIVFWATRR